MADLAIAADGLRKRFGDPGGGGKLALDGFGLTVPAGTVHGLLGPNGAGKTTAVRALTTLLRYDEGRAEICGLDVARRPDEVRGLIGLTGQYAAVDEQLSGRQNLVMFGTFHGLGRRGARRRADELLERFGLTEAAGRNAGQYSGGMRRRLDLAASMVRVPRVLFLDEPTTGLDPRSRNQVWDAVRSLVAGGTTVLLTTQYLEEADQLADRISVIDAGRIAAEGTADDLKARLGGARIEVVVRDFADLAGVTQLLAGVAGPGARPESDPDTRRASVPVSDHVAALTGVARALHEAGITVEDIGTRRPTLDEAFLHLTGHTTDAGKERAA
ncbi:ATP-binding cassette domain-containing protein [Streptomyces sp. NPDC049881]|uniref:ATP-binding cassette domain-containing protein n=1 Tax=unclassified Streptomyces TaxID=2593676 RepID=UPI003419F5A1